MAATKAPAKTRTLIVERAGKGQMRITIPAASKVTYGTLQPGRGGHHFNDRNEGNVLRIYEGTKQTAVFQNVLEFRDEQYPVEVEVVETFNDANDMKVDGKVVRAEAAMHKNRRWEAL